MMPTAPIEWATKQIGQKELAGSKRNNPWIVALFKFVRYVTRVDETPWCAAFVNAALINTGFKGTGSAAAKSFVNYGEACVPEYGAIIVIQHANGGHHVTFFDEWIEYGKVMACIGGNQANQVKVSQYELGPGHDRIIASRRPVAA